ncbi:MAG: macro domain-containing protein [Planctomycetales bacterium]
MTIRLIRGDLLDSDAEAIALTIDGAGPGLEGGVARAFAKRFPEAWAAVESQIQYPIPLGDADAFPIEEDTARERLVILASTLHHTESFSENDKRAVVRDAFRNALESAAIHRKKSLAAAIFSGGWRLSSSQAMNEMVNTYLRLAMHKTLPDLHVHVIEDEEADRLGEFFDQLHYLTVEKTSSGFVIERKA